MVFKKKHLQHLTRFLLLKQLWNVMKTWQELMEEYIGFPQSLAPNPMRNDSLMTPDRGPAGEIELKVPQRMISYLRAMLHGWYAQAKRIRLEVSRCTIKQKCVLQPGRVEESGGLWSYLHGCSLSEHTQSTSHLKQTSLKGKRLWLSL